MTPDQCHNFIGYKERARDESETVLLINARIGLAKQLKQLIHRASHQT